MKIMSLFKNKLDAYEEHEQLLVEKVIKALRENPENFSAKWFSGKSLDKSVRNKKGDLTIMINTGDIVSPIEPEMTTKQKETVKKLLESIVKRDSESLIKNFTV